jgi:hypothetical protein
MKFHIASRLRSDVVPRRAAPGARSNDHYAQLGSTAPAGKRAGRGAGAGAVNVGAGHAAIRRTLRGFYRERERVDLAPAGQR